MSDITFKDSSACLCMCLFVLSVSRIQPIYLCYTA